MSSQVTPKELSEALARASDEWLDRALDRCMSKGRSQWVHVDLSASGDMTFTAHTSKHTTASVKDLYNEKLRRLQCEAKPKYRQGYVYLDPKGEAKVEPMPPFELPVHNITPYFGEGYAQYVYRVLNALVDHYNNHVVARLNNPNVQMPDPAQVEAFLNTPHPKDD